LPLGSKLRHPAFQIQTLEPDLSQYPEAALEAVRDEAREAAEEAFNEKLQELRELSR
jgi:hypothetical protein